MASRSEVIVRGLALLLLGVLTLVGALLTLTMLAVLFVVPWLL